MQLTEPGPNLQAVTLMRDWVESFDIYPFNLPVIRELRTLAFHPKVTYFIGENGSGKSTLLEGIAVATGFNAEGGSRNFNFATRESHSALFKCLRLTFGAMRSKRPEGFFLRAESFYNVATEIERLGVLDYYGGTSLHDQSHGESFFAVLMKRFRGSGLYLLDEPESALSPSRQMSMLTLMHQLLGRGSQFIIATHSPIIMAYPESTVYQFSSKGIQPIEYHETENYKVMKAFFTRKDQMLRELLSDE